MYHKAIKKWVLYTSTDSLRLNPQKKILVISLSILQSVNMHNKGKRE